jgi:hypothetical protein
MNFCRKKTAAKPKAKSSKPLDKGQTTLKFKACVFGFPLCRFLMLAAE